MRVALNTCSLMSPDTGTGSYARNLAHAINSCGDVDLLFYAFVWDREIGEITIPRIDAAKTIVKKMVPSPYSRVRYFEQRRFDSSVSGFALAFSAI